MFVILFFYLVCYFYLTIHHSVWHVYLSLEMDPVCVCVFSFWLIFFWWFFFSFSLKIVTKLIWKVSGDSIHLVFQNKTFGKKFCKKLARYAKWLSCRWIEWRPRSYHSIERVWCQFPHHCFFFDWMIMWLYHFHQLTFMIDRKKRWRSSLDKTIRPSSSEWSKKNHFWWFI